MTIRSTVILMLFIGLASAEGPTDVSSSGPDQPQLGAEPTKHAQESKHTITPEAIVQDGAGDITYKVPLRTGQEWTQPTPTPDLDPHLKSGFPVYTDYVSGGTYHGGPAIHALVGNIDAEPNLEILATSLATGPLYAWKADGTYVAGWPATQDGAAYPALGRLSSSLPGLQVFAGYFGMYPGKGHLAALTGSADHLPGWPQESYNFVTTPPSLADIDGDGIDEIFVNEEDYRTHGYRADGSVIPGWPTTVDEDTPGAQDRHTPAIGDIDGDGIPEIVTVPGPTKPGGIHLLAYRRDGTMVPGFPVQFEDGLMADTFVALGDMDADGVLDIVIPVRDEPDLTFKIVSGNGTVMRTIPIPVPPVDGFYYGQFNMATVPVLADLDDDGIPEIVTQGENFATVLKADGTVFPGWPQTWTNNWLTSSAPVVGDVDGDGKPDLVFTSGQQQPYMGVSGNLRAYDRNGNMLSGFPKELTIGSAGVPAIADIDLDGRNDIIVIGDAWDGYNIYPRIWAYDLHGPGPYGPIEWGQFMRDARHQGVYNSSRFPLPRCPAQRFGDVCPFDYFYEAVLALNDAQIVSGYQTSPQCDRSSGTPCFKPYNNITRGQAAKLIALAANVSPHQGGQIFEDVPPGSPFYNEINALASRSYIGGYPCGGTGEPCDTENRPYFRPGNSITRGQLAKTVSNAAGFVEAHSQQTFEDVPTDAAFYIWIQRLASRNIINGYSCGAASELCVAPHNRSYFRPNNKITRGQTAKIVYGVWSIMEERTYQIK